MRIRIDLSQAFAKYAAGETKVAIELPEGSQVRDAVFYLRIPLSDAKTLALNGRLVKPTEELAEGSLLVIAPEIPLE